MNIPLQSVMCSLVLVPMDIPLLSVMFSLVLFPRDMPCKVFLVINSQGYYPAMCNVLFSGSCIEGILNFFNPQLSV